MYNVNRDHCANCWDFDITKNAKANFNEKQKVAYDDGRHCAGECVKTKFTEQEFEIWHKYTEIKFDENFTNPQLIVETKNPLWIQFYDIVIGTLKNYFEEQKISKYEGYFWWGFVDGLQFWAFIKYIEDKPSSLKEISKESEIKPIIDRWVFREDEFKRRYPDAELIESIPIQEIMKGAQDKKKNSKKR